MMTSLLSRSVNLAGRSRPVAERTLCSRGSISSISRSRIPSRLPRPYARYYATVNHNHPRPDKDTKDEKKDSKSSEEGEKATESTTDVPGKPPPGFEQIFNHKNQSSPLSAPSGGTQPEKDAAPESPSGNSPLNDEELEILESVALKCKKSLPEEYAYIVDKAVDKIKKGGGEMYSRLEQDLTSHKPDGERITRRPLVSQEMETLMMLHVWAAWKAGLLDKKDKSEEDEADSKGSDNAQDRWSQQVRGSQQDRGGQRSGWGFNFTADDVKPDAWTLIISSVGSWYLYNFLFPAESSRDITWQEFRTTFLDKGLVDKLTVINRTKVRVELHREAVAKMYPESPALRGHFYYHFTIGSVEAFEKRLDDAYEELDIPSPERIPVAYVEEVPMVNSVMPFLPTLVTVGLVYWFARLRGGGTSGQAGLFGIGKSRARRFNHETDVKTKFSDVAGMDEAKLEIMEFVSFLKDPTRYQSLGAKIPRGAILSGPPGTGKTLLAKATAGESGVPFFSVSGSEFVEMFVGVGPSRVRDLFANARKNTPCIIFIDEIDAIGKSRSKSNYGGNDERESTLNQILTEMDGFNTSDQVVVLAGTNRPDVLDKALMRPGRFDRHIFIDRPTMDGRKQIFLVHLKNIVTNVDREYLTGRLAALTPGFSGADIANCVNEAALIGEELQSFSCTSANMSQLLEQMLGRLT